VKKIVIVTNSISGGGAERSMNLLANMLFEQGKSVTLIAINKSDPDAISIKCPVFKIDRVWNGSLIDTINSWFKFQKILIKLGAEITILNCDLPEFFGAISFSRSKIICVEHSNNPWYTRTKLGIIIRKILSMKKVTWVGVSNFIKVWPSEIPPKIVIPNPIWRVNKNFDNFSGPIKRLIFVGRLTYQKNPQAFLEVVKQTNISGLILGTGPDIDEIKSLIESSHIDVELKGFVQDPWEFLTNGDLLLVPSRWEGDGLVVIEALQRKVPIIVSSIHEFKRFKLPNVNYAANTQDFIRLIRENAKKSQVFKVSSGINQKVFASRDPNNISASWINLIDSIKNSQ